MTMSSKPSVLNASLRSVCHFSSDFRVPLRCRADRAAGHVTFLDTAWLVIEAPTYRAAAAGPAGKGTVAQVTGAGVTAAAAKEVAGREAAAREAGARVAAAGPAGTVEAAGKETGSATARELARAWAAPA